MGKLRAKEGLCTDGTRCFWEHYADDPETNDLEAEMVSWTLDLLDCDVPAAEIKEALNSAMEALVAVTTPDDRN